MEVRKQREYFFQKIRTKTEDGLLFNNQNEEEDVEFVAKNYDTNSVSKNDIEIPVVPFSFISEKKERTILRIYEKISDLLAKLGGIMNTLILLGWFWFKIEHKLIIKKIMLNNLYGVQYESGPNQNIKKLKKRKVQTKNLINSNNSERIHHIIITSPKTVQESLVKREDNKLEETEN